MGLTQDIKVTIPKEFRIKSGVLKRTLKDYESYRNEGTELSQRLESMPQGTEDERYLYAKQEELVAENRQVLTDTSRKLQAACSDLEAAADKYAAELGQCPEMLAAREMIQQGRDKDH